MSDVQEILLAYVQNWQAITGVKPENEEAFIEAFLEFIKDQELRFTFDGDGAYFGKQISIDRGWVFGYDVLSFEVAYSPEALSIYSGNHNGFWVPEYVTMTNKHPAFQKLYQAICDFIRVKVGI